ncbi:MAG: type II and III secretion system protein family protein, partial [Desulfobulbaceae bacterium]|nr:type II and III secretion system protein family protein [Desulfobulbaceae bacterium]
GILTLYGLCMVTPGWGSGIQAQIVVDTQTPQALELVVGKLGKIRSDKPILRSFIANPEIAEIIYSKTQSPKWVFCSAKLPGTTQLTLWDEQNNIIGIYDIMVSADLASLKTSLHDIFPGEDIRVIPSNDYITLSGTISGAGRLSHVLALAEAYAPGKVINLLQVGGIQQVMLEVRIAEMSRSLGKRLGVNFNWMNDTTIGLSLLDQITKLPPDGFPENPLVVSPGVNAIFSYFSGSHQWTAFLDAMKEEGLIEILAKPTLVSLSGQNASFLAGGEFPVPVPDEDGLAIEWKDFGVGLNFTPTVLDNGTISMKVAPEVSELDYSTALTLQGYVVPGLTTRRTSTVVELKDGQSFAIAGLLKNVIREKIHKFPLLGDIPILGALFRSSSFQKNETELVVIVTPHLVKPFNAGEQPLPTDSFVEPDDYEFYMLGLLEGRGGNQVDDAASVLQPSKKGLEGDFGYIVPE